ncbi:DUF3306 domain-containing protein [Caenispirillum salinarum]|uniref:DUF3306 domain-containing protein n=1 Tax=Caenispirillum salinarum TaxID=859058 RepID=UPI00384A4AA4
MTESSKGFLARWSRLKTEHDGPLPAQPHANPAEAPPHEQADDDAPFDPETLPPLELLDRDSDYSAFLHRKVPEALRRAALRKAWTSDPAITGYKPLVEYDWDCNAPGYAALRPGESENAVKAVKAMFAHLQREPEGQETSDSPPSDEPEAET